MQSRREILWGALTFRRFFDYLRWMQRRFTSFPINRTSLVCRFQSSRLKSNYWRSLAFFKKLQRRRLIRTSLSLDKQHDWYTHWELVLKLWLPWKQDTSCLESKGGIRAVRKAKGGRHFKRRIKSLIKLLGFCSDKFNILDLNQEVSALCSKWSFFLDKLNFFELQKA